MYTICGYEVESMELKWKTCLRAGVTVVVLFLVIHYWTAFTALAGIAFGAARPLFWGCVIAYVVNIPMNFFERLMESRAKNEAVRKLARPVCMVLAFLCILLIAVLIVQMIVPELIGCLQILLKELPGVLDSISRWIEENLQDSMLLAGQTSLFQGGETDWQEMLTKVVNILINGIGGVMGAATSIISTVFSTVVTLTVGLVFAIYLLLGKEKLSGQFRRLSARYLPKKVTEKFYYVAGVVNQSFHSFIVGQCTEAVILGLLCMGGMLLLRLPYAAMIGCLVGFTALIPVAGAYIGAVVGAFMIFTVSPVKAVIFIAFLVALQQLEGNLVYPRVVGSSIGLPGVWVLAAVTVGGGVMGVGGMLLGVPLAAAAYQLLKKDMNTPS